ncbi:hypothetical protein C8J57DRAFT_1507249 [Mycena rebaudengoi]|nr:hypothetical protein C8J57DRAFT_1507249 [Mycena rebaudengoi]
MALSHHLPGATEYIHNLRGHGHGHVSPLSRRLHHRQHHHPAHHGPESLRPSQPAGAVATFLMTLAEKNVPFELVMIDISQHQHKSAAYRALQPFGQVPCIMTMTASPSSKAAPSAATSRTNTLIKFIPKEVEARALFEQAASIETAHFHPLAFALYREVFAKPRMGLTKDPARFDRLVAELSAKLDVYEQILGRQRYFGGDAHYFSLRFLEFTLADIFHVSFGVLLAHVGCDLMTRKGPNVVRWWTDILARPSWRAVEARIRAATPAVAALQIYRPSISSVPAGFMLLSARYVNDGDFRIEPNRFTGAGYVLPIIRLTDRNDSGEIKLEEFQRSQRGKGGQVGETAIVTVTMQPACLECPRRDCEELHEKRVAPTLMDAEAYAFPTRRPLRGAARVDMDTSAPRWLRVFCAPTSARLLRSGGGLSLHAPQTTTTVAAQRLNTACRSPVDVEEISTRQNPTRCQCSNLCATRVASRATHSGAAPI